MIFYWLFSIQYQLVLSTCHGAYLEVVLNLNKEQPILVYRGPNSF